jgi:hypothetical protein
MIREVERHASPSYYVSGTVQSFHYLTCNTCCTVPNVKGWSVPILKNEVIRNPPEALQSTSRGNPDPVRTAGTQ